MRRRAVIAVIGWGAATAASAGQPARVNVADRVGTIASEARLDPAAPPEPHRLRLDDRNGRLRTGVGGSMVNLLPMADSRFHLSAGARLFARPRPSKALDERGLLTAPRGSAGGWRGGRRFAPAFLMGVDEPAATNLSFGIDAGVVLGPAMDRGMRGQRGLRGGGRGMPQQANGIARVTVDYRF